MLLSLLLTACLAASPTPQSNALQSDMLDLPAFQQFCLYQGFGNCFAVNNVDLTSASVTVGDRPPLPITGLEQFPITALGETGTEFMFTTLWGRGLLVQMPDDEAFSGEIHLANDMVLHIFPCADREECTSFGYELHAERIPEAMMDDDTDNVSRRLRRLLQSLTGSNRPSAAPKSDSASVEALRRSLQSDDDTGDCEGSDCMVTLRMVFQESESGWAPFSINYSTFCRFAAMLVVAEFNAAMRLTVDTSYRSYHMRLDSVEWSAFNSPWRANRVCTEHMDHLERSTGLHTDLTQCVFNEERLWDINSRGGYDAGATCNMCRASWVQWRAMPFLDWGDSLITTHEFGHQFAATHANGRNSGNVVGTVMVQPDVAPRHAMAGFSPENAALIRRAFPTQAREK